MFVKDIHRIQSNRSSNTFNTPNTQYTPASHVPASRRSWQTEEGRYAQELPSYVLTLPVLVLAFVSSDISSISYVTIPGPTTPSLIMHACASSRSAASTYQTKIRIKRRLFATSIRLHLQSPSPPTHAHAHGSHNRVRRMAGYAEDRTV